MANNLTGEIKAFANFTLTSAQGLASAAAAPYNEVFDIVYANGTGSKAADMTWTKSGDTIATTSLANIYAFSASVQKDAFGGNFNPAKVKALMVLASSTNANNILIGGSTQALLIFNAAAQQLPLQPGGCFLWALPGTGITVSAGVSDTLGVFAATPGSTLTYDVVLLATSV